MVKNMSDLDIILKFIILLKIVYIIKSKTNMIDQKGQSGPKMSLQVWFSKLFREQWS